MGPRASRLTTAICSARRPSSGISSWPRASTPWASPPPQAPVRLWPRGSGGGGRAPVLGGAAAGGGAGEALAEWVGGGEPSIDLWDVDIRRFTPFQGNARYLRERTR